MSQSIKLACFLLLLPFFAAIGHDIYVNYYGDPDKAAETSQQLENLQLDPETYQASDLGYLLVNYTPGLYDGAKASVGDENWVRFVDPVLQQYTFAIALVPAVLFYLYLLIARVTHLPPFKDAGSSFSKAPPVTQKDKSLKYKRR
jgi:hypothetical protein